MRLAAIAAALCIAGAPSPEAKPAAAQDLPDDAVAIARNNVSPNSYDLMILMMLNAIVPQLEQSAAAKGMRLRPDGREQLLGLLQEILPYEEMVRVSARILAQRLTLDELKQAATFFRSPTGKKMAGLGPEALAVGQKWAQERFQGAQVKIAMRMNDLIERVPDAEK